MRLPEQVLHGYLQPDHLGAIPQDFGDYLKFVTEVLAHNKCCVGGL